MTLTQAPEAAPAPSLEQVAALVAARRARTRTMAALAALAGLVLGAGGAATVAALAGGSDQEDELVVAPLAVAQVEQRDLEVSTEYEGTLGYGDPVAIVSRGDGTLTSVPAAGRSLERGDVAFTLDEQPVVLLYGDVPAWRTLKAGVDDGPDVRQLEKNLDALGYTAGGDLEVNETFDDATEDAVLAWEEELGRADADGVVDPAEIAIADGIVRVDDSDTPGAVIAAGDEVLSVVVTREVVDRVRDGEVVSTDSATQAVSLSVTTDEREDFAEGDVVVIEMADGELADGSVADIGTAATSTGTDDALVDVLIAVSDGFTGTLLEGPATVRVVTEVREDALVVPLRALVALAEGGYAVEVVGEDGSTSYVAVDAGLFQDGYVEVEGDLSDGDTVVVPS